jgi:hypothetical protein
MSTSIVFPEPRTPIYLSVSQARSRLIAAGFYTAQTVPGENIISEWLLELEDVIDEWVCHRIAETRYQEVTRTNQKGVILLNHYPVVEVEEVAIYADQPTNSQPIPLSPSEYSGIWRQDRRVYTSLINIPVRVVYCAGIDPIPRILASTIYLLLHQFVEKGCPPTGFSFLNKIHQDVKSISLPGGLSKSFETYRSSGKSLTGSGPGGALTELDYLLAPLERYRYPVVTA